MRQLHLGWGPAAHQPWRPVAGHRQQGLRVSQWMDEHPGGDFVLLQEAGKDATDAFADIGHSLYAEGLLKDYYPATSRVDPLVYAVRPKGRCTIIEEGGG